MTRSRLLIAAVLGLSLLAGACSTEKKVKTVAAADRRKQAPDFTLKDADGRDVKLSDYRGKVVLLNFWATWCGPCQVEIPWFIEFQQKYRDRGFEVLGVSMDDDGWKVVKPFIAESKINYRIAVGNDTVGTLYGGLDSLPTTFVIDRDGKVAASHVGLINKNEYQNEILQLLSNTSASNRDSGNTSGAGAD